MALDARKQKIDQSNGRWRWNTVAVIENGFNAPRNRQTRRTRTKNDSAQRVRVNHTIDTLDDRYIQHSQARAL